MSLRDKKENTMTSKEEILKEFKNRFNPEEPCTFVPAFLEEALDRIEAETRKQTAEEIIDEIIVLRSGYVYDDYSSLYQKSGELWTEYAEEESKLLNKLKAKYGIQETEKNE